MFAAESRRKALVEAMLDFNPDLTIKGASNKTALDYAEGDDEISSLIRERGGLSLSHAFQSIPGCLPFHFRVVHRSFIRQPCKDVALIPYHILGFVPGRKPSRVRRRCGCFCPDGGESGFALYYY